MWERVFVTLNSYSFVIIGVKSHFIRASKDLGHIWGVFPSKSVSPPVLIMQYLGFAQLQGSRKHSYSLYSQNGAKITKYQSVLELCVWVWILRGQIDNKVFLQPVWCQRPAHTFFFFFFGHKTERCCWLEKDGGASCSVSSFVKLFSHWKIIKTAFKGFSQPPTGFS